MARVLIVTVSALNRYFLAYFVLALTMRQRLHYTPGTGAAHPPIRQSPHVTEDGGARYIAP